MTVLLILVLAFVFLIAPWMDRSEKRNRTQRRQRWQRFLDDDDDDDLDFADLDWTSHGKSRRPLETSNPYQPPGLTTIDDE